MIWSNTTAQPSFNLEDVPNLPVPIPPAGEWKAIGGVMKSLDDRVALKRRMNETLEAMARAFFKTWFFNSDLTWTNKDAWRVGGEL
jgi:type I restriction enzyme S subunit